MIKLFTVPVPKTASVDDVLHSGYITEGPRVKEFEGELARLLGNPNIATVNSGTSALTLALIASGVGAGDYVITTPMTCSATNLAILSVGAIPVFADVNPLSGNIDAGSVEELAKIGKQNGASVKAIMCVDWGGLPCNIFALAKIAEQYDLKLIEDAAHAFGSRYNEVQTGAGKYADFTCFSFQAIKHLTTGDGGLIACKNAEDCAFIKKLRWFGIDRDAPAKDTRIDQEIEYPGYKMHMNDIAAAIGLSQINGIHRRISMHSVNSTILRNELCQQITVSDPGISTLFQSSYWIYTLKLKDAQEVEDFIAHLAKAGIQASKVHRNNLDYKVFEDIMENYDRPGLKDFYERMVCIPCHADLSDADLQKIITETKKFTKKRGYCS